MLKLLFPREYIYIRNLDATHAFTFEGFLLVLRFGCYVTCGTATMTSGLFPFYSATVVNFQFILMLLFAMPVLT
jgi:hypothetical protein